MTRQILIADSGSTKTDWLMVGEEGERLLTVKTCGLNPYHLTEEEIASVLRTQLLDAQPDEVYFYGSGVTEAMQRPMQQLLEGVFTTATRVETEGDLTGAARALFGVGEGIACILGTGANSGYYRDGKIVQNIPPLGYILGDEGSGADLGKHFLNLIFKDAQYAAVKAMFLAEYNLTYADIINKVYREPQANRFLASLAPFIHECAERGREGDLLTAPYDCFMIRKMVIERFEAFYKKNIAHYVYKGRKNIGFVGSIAAHFRPELEEVFRFKNRPQLSDIQASPLEGLVSYHTRG